MARNEIDFITLFLKLHNYMELPWSPSKSFLLMAPKRPEGLIHFFASKTWTLKMSDLEICLYFLSTYTCISKVLERLLFKELVLIGVAKSWSTDEIIHHGSYKWIIMLEKCGRPNLNVFHLNWIIGTHGNWKNQNPWSPFGATS